MSIASSDVDLALIQALALLMRNTELGELEIEQAGYRLRLRRDGMSAQGLPASSRPADWISGNGDKSSGSAEFALGEPAAGVCAQPTTCRVDSPMVGIAYMAPAPGEAAFVTVGAQVRAGQTLLAIEAMKTLNFVTAPQDGEVADILVLDGQAVEFDQPLVVLK